MGGLEAVITGLMDEFKFKHIKREHFTAIILLLSFFGSLINCTQVSNSRSSLPCDLI